MTGAELITQERERQIEEESWSFRHDDGHKKGELALAACCYAAPVPLYMLKHSADAFTFGDPWPWEGHWDKREKHDRIRRLVIAGALIAAEIDRLQRRAEKGRE